MANYYSYDERDSSYTYSYYYGYQYNAGYYDASGSVGTSYYLGTGESAYGYISSYADKDYYSLGYLSGGAYQYTVQANGTYWADNTSSGAYNTPNVSIYNSYGNLVKSGSGGSVTFSPGSSGYYYVAVSDDSPSQYKLTLSETYVYNYYTPSVSSAYAYLNENSSAGISVHDVYAYDYDGGSITYAIYSGNTDVDGDGKLAFSIRSSDGLITVNDAGDLNYEAQSSFSLGVSASDGSKTGYGTVSVYLNDVNEGPTLSSYVSGVNENSGYGTYVGYVYTSGYSGTVNYSITGGNTDVDGDGSLPFYVAKSSNGWAYIYVNDAGDLNYENRSYFDLKVSATDYYGTATTATTVYLSDVNEGPTLSASGYSINENSGYGTYAGYVYTSSYVGTVNYSITDGNTDVDGDGSLPFYVAKSSNGWAYIYVNDAGDLNYENQSYFDLKVSATDYYGTATTAATVSLVNVNEASTGSVVISGSAVEGQVLEVASTVQDPDGMGSTTIQWLRDESVISGATSSSYTLTAADVGKSIAARLSYTDGGGFAESRTSAAVTPVGLNPGVSITGSDKTTGEDGNTAVFSVKLKTAPVDPVTIKFAVSDATEAKLSATSLTFTKANWNVAQSLTVTGLDDYDNDSNVAYNLTASVVTSDLSYKRVTVTSIGLTNNDDKLDASIQKYGTDDIDYLKGNNGADRLYGKGNMDDIRGGRGDDRIYGEQDDDVLYGDDGDDWVYGGYDDDLVDGGSGNDELYGEQGADTLKGGSGNDTLDGGTGADSMVGGAGNDTYYVDNANDVIDDQGATTDEDTVIVTATVTYKLAANVENAELEDTSGAASLTGNTLGNDLTGNDSKNTLDGGAGSDVLDAGAGNDTLLGGDGTDSLTGGLGNDSLNGGTGDDLVDYSDAAAGFVNVNLATGSASGDGADTLVSIEDVIGSDGNDTIVGSAAGNELTGGLGDDSLNGGGGADVLYSGTGNDTVDAGEGDDLIIGGDGAGNDKYIGGAGIDTVKYTSATAGITVDLIKGTATSTAGNDVAKIGTDTLTGIENVIAGNYDDIVKGSALSNILTGGLGTDSLYGGIDKVKDIFDFNAITESKTGSARDKVYNFVSKLDKLDLSGIDANTATAKAGDQAFVFNGTTAKANSVWYKVVDVDGNTATKDIVVYGDVDGNATADFEIGLVGVTAVVATDFVL